MKVGDLIEFETGFLGTILSHDESISMPGNGTFKILIHGDCPFKNPTWIGVWSAQTTAKVIK